jgi:hypothetical protein
MARPSRFSALGPVLLVCVLCGAGAAPASAAPRNDDFGDALRLRLGTAVSGTVTGATNQSGEPRHARSRASHSVWYRFTATRKVAVALNTCNANFDTVVAVYRGARLRSLRTVDFNDDGCGTEVAGSRVTFTARRGRTYRVAVVGFSDRGRFQMVVRSLNTPPNDDFVDATPLRLGSTLAGTLVRSTTELNEPRDGDTGTVWYMLSVSARRRIRLSIADCDPEIPNIVVWRGRTLTGLRYVSAAYCYVTWTARARAAYRIQVSINPGDQAPFRITARAVS